MYLSRVKIRVSKMYCLVCACDACRVSRVAQHLVTTIKQVHFVFDDALPSDEDDDVDTDESPGKSDGVFENADEQKIADITKKLTGGVETGKDVEDLRPGKLFSFLRRVLATPFAQVGVVVT